MDPLEHDLADTLRVLARESVAPSQMLREVVRRAGPDRADRQFLVRVVSAAFRFVEGEGYVVFGWLPDGTGGLSDSQLDYHLSKRIRAARPLWDIPQEQSASEPATGPSRI
ncbi:MAG: hypothetical protein K2V38_17205 [Gemmataceae bacterium]|nr:hypothetical protein [Gemmataceae bacterium]